MFLIPTFAATDLGSFESDRRHGLFFLLSILFITIHDQMNYTTYVYSIVRYAYACFIRKTR